MKYQKGEAAAEPVDLAESAQVEVKAAGVTMAENVITHAVKIQREEHAQVEKYEQDLWNEADKLKKQQTHLKKQNTEKEQELKRLE